jgi:hypothetical protein
MTVEYPERKGGEENGNLERGGDQAVVCLILTHSVSPSTDAEARHSFLFLI